MALIDETIGTDVVHRSDWKVSATGDLQKITGIENLRLNLLHRLVTSPGAFIHLPNYGVGIKDFQNSVMNISNQGKIAERIRNQFLRDERVEDVVSVRFRTEDNTPSTLKIEVVVKAMGYGDIDLRFIPFGEVA